MRAVFWILSGNRYIDEARISAQSVREAMPDLYRVLLTPDKGIERGREFERMIQLPMREHDDNWFLDSLRYLLMGLDMLPEHLLWLDSDTYACMQFGEMFDVLERFDLTGAHSPARRTTSTYYPLPLCFPELQIGVNGLRNSQILKDFVRSWYRLFCEHKEVYRQNDQGSLRDALWEQAGDNNILDCFQFYVLPPEWNLRMVSRGYFLRDKVRFLHGRPGNRMLHEDPDAIRRLAEAANSKEEMRIWKPT